MKHLPLALLALLLLAPTANTQILPDTPAAPPDPSWNRLRSLPAGQPVLVTTTDNRCVHCLFGTVTDTYLFCNPPGNPADVGFRLDRAEIVSVDLDRPLNATAQGPKHERGYHPAWISSMIAGGLIVGLIASQNTNAGKAAQDGLIGAGVVGLIGAPFVFLPQPNSPPPYGGTIYGIGVRLRSPTVAHSHAILHLR